MILIDDYVISYIINCGNSESGDKPFWLWREVNF